MWEVISANKRRSAVLLVVMAMLMIGVGMLIAELIAQGAWLFGGVVALLLWTILSLVSYYSGDAIFLASALKSVMTSALTFVGRPEGSMIQPSSVLPSNRVMILPRAGASPVWAFSSATIEPVIRQTPTIAVQIHRGCRISYPPGIE